MNKHKKSRHRSRRGRDRELIEDGLEDWEIDQELLSPTEAPGGKDPSREGPSEK